MQLYDIFKANSIQDFSYSLRADTALSHHPL